MSFRDSDRRETSDEYARRHLLRTAGATVATAGLAGCGRATNYEFRAPPVVLPAEARRANYETMLDTPVSVQRSRTIGGVEVTATVESHLTVYAASDDARRESASVPTLGAASTPTASVLGRSFNPLARQSVGNLLTSETGSALLQRVGVTDIGHSRSTVRWERGPTFIAGREGTCIGMPTTLESYAGVLHGEPPTVAFIHLNRVFADSVVISIAVHGHDVEDPGRAFVGPDSGYLSPDTFDAVTSLFADSTASLRYRGEG